MRADVFVVAPRAADKRAAAAVRALVVAVPVAAAVAAAWVAAALLVGHKALALVAGYYSYLLHSARLRHANQAFAFRWQRLQWYNGLRLGYLAICVFVSGLR